MSTAKGGRRAGDKFWSIEARPWTVLVLLISFLGSGFSNILGFYQRDAAQQQALEDNADRHTQATHQRDRELDFLHQEILQLQQRCRR